MYQCLDLKIIRQLQMAPNRIYLSTGNQGIREIATKQNKFRHLVNKSIVDR